jgi:hypothetical protein
MIRLFNGYTTRLNRVTVYRPVRGRAFRGPAVACLRSPQVTLKRLELADSTRVVYFSRAPQMQL